MNLFCLVLFSSNNQVIRLIWETDTKKEIKIWEYENIDLIKPIYRHKCNEQTSTQHDNTNTHETLFSFIFVFLLVNIDNDKLLPTIVFNFIILVLIWIEYNINGHKHHHVLFSILVY